MISAAMSRLYTAIKGSGASANACMRARAALTRRTESSLASMSPVATCAAMSAAHCSRSAHTWCALNSFSHVIVECSHRHCLDADTTVGPIGWLFFGAGGVVRWATTAGGLGAESLAADGPLQMDAGCELPPLGALWLDGGPSWLAAGSLCERHQRGCRGTWRSVGAAPSWTCSPSHRWSSASCRQPARTRRGNAADGRPCTRW